MKRVALALCLALLLLFTVGCGSKYPFVGKWQEEGTGTYYEFTNESQLLVGQSTDSIAVGASFSCEDNSDKITITIAPPGGTEQSQVVTYSMNEDGSILTLKNAQGEQSILKKIQ